MLESYKNSTSLSKVKEDQHDSFPTQKFDDTDTLGLGPDAGEVQKDINQMIDNLSLCDKDVFRLQTALNEALRNRADQRTAIHRYASQRHLQISPTRRLPAEIISKILYLSANHHQTLRDDTSEYRKSVLLLSSICHRWREIALSMAGLWNWVKVEFGKKTDVTREVQMMNTWLERSGGKSIVLIFWVQEDYDTKAEVSTKAQEVIFQTIIAKAGRLKFTDFMMPSSFLDALYPLRGRLDRLRTLNLSLYRVQNSPLPLSSIETFKVAPKLRHLRLGMHKCHSLLELNLLAMPWHQLTTLRLPPNSSFSECDILKLTPNLVDCQVTSEEPGVFHTPPEPIQLSRLKNLEFSTPRDISELLNSLTLPALHSFVYTYPVLRVWPQASVLSLISRSRCCLQTLSLDIACLRSMLEIKDLMVILQSVPSLIRLTVKSMDITAALKGLTRSRQPLPGSYPDILPQLRFLAFDAKSRDFDPHVFLEMVKSRRDKSLIANSDQSHPPALIGTVEIGTKRLSSRKRKAMLPSLLELIDGGLVVHEVLQ